MASSSEAIFGVVTSQVVVAPGATNAVYISAEGGQGALLIKYLSGSTLEIQGSINGSTMAGASLAPLIGTGYIMGTNEVLSLAGPARLYLMATGATTIACIMKGLSAPGFPNFAFNAVP